MQVWGVCRLLRQPAVPRGSALYVNWAGEACRCDLVNCALGSRGALPHKATGSVRVALVSDTHLRHRDLQLPPSGAQVSVGEALALRALSLARPHEHLSRS